MTVRHAVLSIGAVLVLGLGVYLFVEVRAQAVAPPGPSRPVTERDRTVAPERPAAAAPAATRMIGARAPTSAQASPAPQPAPSSPALAAHDPAGSQAEPDGPGLAAAMDDANRAYDRGDFDEARALASRLLARQPGNVRMLRILVSASCIDGDSAAAQASYVKLPPADQAQMRIRCARYGIAFSDRP